MHICKAAIVLLILTLLASFYVESTTLEAQTTTNSSDDNWPMFHHDPAHTGMTTGSAPASSPVELWSFEAENLLGDPIVVDDTVYIATAANMWALNAFSGETIWTIPTGHEGGVRIVVEDGVIYSSNYCAYNASTGTQLWNTTSARSGPLAVSDGYLFGQDKDAFVVCLNASTGREVWKSQSYSTSFYPAIANGVIYFGTGSGLEALDAKDGTKIWEQNTLSMVSGSPTIYDDCVYAGNRGGFFYCMNASSGKIVWSYSAGSRIFSSPALAYGCVYFGSQDGNVYALNTSSGEKLWNYTAYYSEYFHRGVRSSPSVANGIVYVCSDDGNLNALNAYTGDKLWNYTVQSALDASGNPQYIDASPVIVHEKIYISSLDRLIALESNDSKTNTSGAGPLPVTSENIALLVALLLIIAILVVAFVLRRRKNP